MIRNWKHYLGVGFRWFISKCSGDNGICNSQRSLFSVDGKPNINAVEFSWASQPAEMLLPGTQNPSRIPSTLRPLLGTSALAGTHAKSLRAVPGLVFPTFPNCRELHMLAALSPAHMREEVQWVQD